MERNGDIQERLPPKPGLCPSALADTGENPPDNTKFEQNTGKSFFWIRSDKFYTKKVNLKTKKTGAPKRPG
jgi:hypothetical protein